MFLIIFFIYFFIHSFSRSLFSVFIFSRYIFIFFIEKIYMISIRSLIEFSEFPSLSFLIKKSIEIWKPASISTTHKQTNSKFVLLIYLTLINQQQKFPLKFVSTTIHVLFCTFSRLLWPMNRKQFTRLTRLSSSFSSDNILYYIYNPNSILFVITTNYYQFFICHFSYLLNQNQTNYKC